MVIKKLVFILVLVIGNSIALAQPATAIGGASCAQWLKEDHTRQYYKFWIGGYLSGINSVIVGMANENKQAQADFLKGSTPVQIEVLIDQHCAARPLDQLAQAALAIAYLLQARR